MRWHLLQAVLSLLTTTLIMVDALAEMIILKHLLKFGLSYILPILYTKESAQSLLTPTNMFSPTIANKPFHVMLSIPQGYQCYPHHWYAKQLYTLYTVYLVSLCLYCLMASRWIGIQICTSSAGMQQAVSLFTTQTLVQCVNTFNAMIS